MPNFNDFDLDLQKLQISRETAIEEPGCTLNPACFASRGPYECATKPRF